jgi:hypothetical protein
MALSPSLPLCAHAAGEGFSVFFSGFGREPALCAAFRFALAALMPASAACCLLSPAPWAFGFCGAQERAQVAGGSLPARLRALAQCAGHGRKGLGFRQRQAALLCCKRPLLGKAAILDLALPAKKKAPLTRGAQTGLA